MNNSANRNPYAFSLDTVGQIFGAHLSGKLGGLVGIVSNLPLGPSAQKALESSASALGFGEGSCCYVIIRTANDDDASRLGANDLHMVIEGVDPLVLVAADAQAASVLSHAYQCDVPTNNASRVLGRTCVAFKGFEQMLDSPDNKQRAWALLKRLKQ